MLLLESCCHCYCQPFVFLYCLKGRVFKIYICVCAYITVCKWLKNITGKGCVFPRKSSQPHSSDGRRSRGWTLWRQVMPKTEKQTLTYNLCQTLRVTLLFVDMSPDPGKRVIPGDWQVMKRATSKSSKQSPRNLQSAFLLKEKKGRGLNRQFLPCYISSRAAVCFCHLKRYLKIYIVDKNVQRSKQKDSMSFIKILLREKKGARASHK